MQSLILIFALATSAQANPMSREEEEAVKASALVELQKVQEFMSPSTVAATKAATENPKIEPENKIAICLESGTLAVRNEQLNKTLFRVRNFETLKIFQGWGENKKQKKLRGKVYKYIKVQFPERNDSIGWIPEQFASQMSECKYKEEISEEEDSSQEALTDSPEIVNAVSTSKETDFSGITGLNHPNCCHFPLVSKATTSYWPPNGGMRMYGYRRGGGKRLHAACDLYQQRNSKILAVAPGTAISNIYKFYQGTYALEVVHVSGFVVRYGEITGKAAAGIKKGAKVIPGQHLGYMGKVNSGCCEPMLHFELFSGKAKGALSVKKGKFKRRSDLMNPTEYLRNWENKTY